MMIINETSGNSSAIFSTTLAELNTTESLILTALSLVLGITLIYLIAKR